MAFVRTIKEYLKRLLRRIQRPLLASKVEELPDVLDKRLVYVVGEGDYSWFAAMICPCGCGEILYMSLMPDDSPRWEVTIHKNGTATLHPSVWRTKGCRSHFSLRNGRLIWHRDILKADSDK